jgi:hypothetical protein
MAINMTGSTWWNIMKQKLKLYGHVSCSRGLANPILQGRVRGCQGLEGQRERWDGNVQKWSGLSVSDSQRMVND